MPPKKKRKQMITTVDTIAALDRLQLLPSKSFSRGAVEALRVCHAKFLSIIAAELALLCSDTVTVTLQPSHVDQCLEKLGLEEYKRQTIKTPAGGAPRAKKRKKWSLELQAEQEKLLTLSKQTMQQQQQEQQPLS